MGKFTEFLKCPDCGYSMKDEYSTRTRYWIWNNKKICYCCYRKNIRKNSTYEREERRRL